MITESFLLLLPMSVVILYRENTVKAFLITILILLLFGILLYILKPKNKVIYAGEGFVIVSLSWILMSLFGVLPFFISGEVPNYIDCVLKQFQILQQQSQELPEPVVLV